MVKRWKGAMLRPPLRATAPPDLVDGQSLLRTVMCGFMAAAQGLMRWWPHTRHSLHPQVKVSTNWRRRAWAETMKMFEIPSGGGYALHPP
jgi:hypothetical protein